MENELPVMLVNTKQARNIPGRKTDVNDATWLANLAAHNLLHGSFIPPEPIRSLRDLTRNRASLVHDRGKVNQRMEKFLESSKDQALSRRIVPYRCIGAEHARCPRCRRTRPVGLGPSGPTAVEGQDPGTRRCDGGAFHRASCVHDAPVPEAN